MCHFNAFRFLVSRRRFESLDAGIETKTGLGLRDITIQMLMFLYLSRIRIGCFLVGLLFGSNLLADYLAGWVGVDAGGGGFTSTSFRELNRYGEWGRIGSGGSDLGVVANAGEEPPLFKRRRFRSNDDGVDGLTLMKRAGRVGVVKGPDMPLNRSKSMFVLLQRMEKQGDRQQQPEERVFVKSPAPCPEPEGMQVNRALGVAWWLRRVYRGSIVRLQKSK
ncbi:hypothetical protein B0H13DRAFT_1875231 [Mycena leptocephala]|nr:hypothetical protein B0H13DRAFT_1875231 [Mycena leptocephala]